MPTGLKTECPHCGKVLRVSVEMAGKRARCPGCQQAFSVSEIGVSSGTSIAPSQMAAETQGTHSTAIPLPPLPPGKRIGRFELKVELGRGGFGQVFRAYDAVLERDVALKLPRFTAVDESQHRRFVIEAKAAAKLKHPHIVGVYECGEADGQPYIVSEFVPGETLAHRLKRERPSLSQAAIWVRDLAEALAYAHREGVVHRDIKPENIMLSAADRPQIMDFGLAKRTNEESSLTVDGSVLGTPAYMSPEQARGDVEHVGPASDQYSLGATLYQLLTGQPPFSGPPHKVVAAVTSVEPAEARSLNPQIPADLQAIVQKAMDKDPARRYADISLFATDLDRWLKGEPVRARPITFLERTVRWCRKNRTVACLVTAVVLISLSGTMITSILWGQAATSGAQARKANSELEAQQSQLIEATEEAKASAKNALAAAEKEKQAKEDLRHRTYVAEINRAQHAVAEGDVMLARQVLEGLKPQANEPELRDFEWHYLWRCCHLSQPLGPRGPNSEAVRSVAFSPDDTRLATTEGKIIHIWNVATKSRERTLEFHKHLVMTVAWHPSGKWLCSGTSNQPNIPGELCLWNTTDWSKVDLETNGLHVMQAMFSSDGQQLFVATAASQPGNGTPGGRYIYFQETLGEVIEYVEPHWKPGRRFRHESSGILSTAVSQDGKWLAAGGTDGNINVWNIAEPEVAPKILSGHSTLVWSLQFTPKRNYLFSAGGNNILGGHAYCWDVESGRMLGALNIDAKCAYTLYYSSRKNLLALAGYDRMVRLWSSDTLLHERQDGTLGWRNSNTSTDGIGLGHVDPIASLAISSDGATIASGSWGGELLLWKTDHVLDYVDWRSSPAGLEPLRKERAFNSSYYMLSSVFQEESPEILLGPPDREGQPPPRFQVESVGTKIRYIAVSYDRKFVALGTWVSQLYVVDVATKAVLHKEQLASHGRPVFSPDNKLMAVAVDNGTIRIYSVGDWKLLRVLSGHKDVIWDVWFHPNGRRLASSGWDQTTRIWDVEHGDELLVLPQWAFGLMFDKEGKTLSCSNTVWRTTLPEEEDAIEAAAQAERVQLAKPPPPTAGVPYDRDFATWFLSHGGNTVSVKRTETTNQPAVDVRSLQELPQERFSVTGVIVGNNVRSMENDSLATLSALPELEHIGIHSAKIGDAAYQHLAKVSKLTVLKVSAGSLSSEGLKHLTGLTSLKYLSINAQRPSTISLNGEGLRLISQLKGISQLYLMSSELRDDDLAPLAELPALSTLRLDNAPIAGAGLKPLEALKKLTHIFISSDVFDDDGAKVIAQFPSLIGMRIRSPAVTNAGIEAISKSQKLMNLDLALKGVDDRGVEHLAGMSSLQHLGFSDMMITDAAIAPLTNLKNLESLSFHQVPITAEGLQHIAKITSLKRLVLSLTEVTQDQFDQFKPTIPNVMVGYQPKVPQN